MSLINQMLKDLQAPKKDRPPLPNFPPPSNKPENSLKARPLALVAVGVAGLGLLWWTGSFFFDPTAEKQPTTAPAVSQPPDIHPIAGKLARQTAPANPRENQPQGVAGGGNEPMPSSKQTDGQNSEQVKAVPRPAPAKSVGPTKDTLAASNLASKPQAAPEALPVTVKRASLPLPPEILPGAVQSSDPGKNESPYKLAERAFLDGKKALLEKHDQVQAINSLQQALNIYAGHVPARELLVGIYLDSGKLEEAAALLNAGIEIAPDYYGFTKAHARILANRGESQAALEIMLRGGLPKISTDPESHEFVATLYSRLGELYLAAQTYRNILAAWPQNGNYWYGLGAALEAQGLPEDATKCYRTALECQNLRQDLRDQATQRMGKLKTATKPS